jgi:predicted hydrocarbon binding protein
MDDLAHTRKRLQHLMVFLCSLWASMEKIYGASAGVMTTAAGKQLGSGLVTNRTQVPEGDILAALEEVKLALSEAGLVWKIEPWKKEEQGDFIFLEGDRARIKLVFRDCILRSCLLYCGRAQDEALCQMAHGYFAGAFEQLSGGKVELAVVHAGENACLKELTWEKRR